MPMPTGRKDGLTTQASVRLPAPLGRPSLWSLKFHPQRGRSPRQRPCGLHRFGVLNSVQRLWLHPSDAPFRGIFNGRGEQGNDIADHTRPPQCFGEIGETTNFRPDGHRTFRAPSKFSIALVIEILPRVTQVRRLTSFRLPEPFLRSQKDNDRSRGVPVIRTSSTRAKKQRNKTLNHLSSHRLSRPPEPRAASRSQKLADLFSY